MVDFVKLKKEDEDKPNKRGYRLSFRKILLIVLAFFLLSSLLSAFTLSLTPKIAIVPIKGVILAEEGMTLYGSGVSSRDIAKILRGIKADSTVKAVILDINSPGGSPVASQEISQAIEDLDIPTYALVNDMAASGGYWVAVSADKIYTSKMSIVGSIGVTSATLGFEDFIVEHNISYRKQTAGELKDMGSPFREPTGEEQKVTQEILNEIHELFIEHIATSRNLSVEKVKEYSTGEIFLGTKAKKIGFIDEFGLLPDVVKEIESSTNESLLVIEYKPEETLLQALGISSLVNFKPQSLLMLE